MNDFYYGFLSFMKQFVMRRIQFTTLKIHPFSNCTPNTVNSAFTAGFQLFISHNSKIKGFYRKLKIFENGEYLQIEKSE